MNRRTAIRIAVTSTVLSVCGAWALVYAQSGPVGKKPAPAAGRSLDAVVELGQSTTARSSLRQQSSGSAMNSYVSDMARKMMGSMAISPTEEDPEMAKLAAAEGELARKSEELLAEYATADKPDEQKRLKSELREALAKQFDVQRERRELELARVEERIRKAREQIRKRNDARDTIVDRRLDQLINDAEGLGWTSPDGTSARPAANNLFRTDYSPGRAPTTPAKR